MTDQEILKEFEKEFSVPGGLSKKCEFPCGYRSNHCVHKLKTFILKVASAAREEGYREGYGKGRDEAIQDQNEA